MAETEHRFDSGWTVMTLDDIRTRKKELGYSIEDLSRISGVPKGTLQKILSGRTAAPRRGTIERLEAALPAGRGSLPGAFSGSGMVREPAAVYGSSAEDEFTFRGKKQGEFTVEDYMALPEDKRYELIDGHLYEMFSPTSNHQVIAGYLYYCLMSCAEQHPAPCYPYIAPLDVQLDKDNRTMVQPDVIVCCDPALNIGKRLFGAPDFLAEVFSPSTKKKDIFIKLPKYKNAGVREYWMIDPDRKQVIIYLFCQDDAIRLYTFDDEIPVTISDGLCSVCFASIKERLVDVRGGAGEPD